MEPFVLILTGPESTGKTTLAKRLSAHFNLPWVPEYARFYIDQLNRPYEQEDLQKIAQGQLNLFQEVAAQQHSLIICDTDILTIKIWSEYKYGDCHPSILQCFYPSKTQHYFLCGTSVPWAADPQREHPYDREGLYEIYKKELLAHQKSFSEIDGSLEERFTQALEILDKFRSKK